MREGNCFGRVLANQFIEQSPAVSESGTTVGFLAVELMLALKTDIRSNPNCCSFRKTHPNQCPSDARRPERQVDLAQRLG